MNFLHDCHVLTFCTEHYHWELRPFFHLLRRFWPEAPPVHVLSNTRPKAPLGDYKFVQLDPDVHEGAFNRRVWSDCLIWYLREQAKDTHLVIMMADYWLDRHVDQTVFQTILGYTRARDDVIRVQLSSESGVNERTVLHTWHRGLEFRDCTKSKPECFLKLSLTPALWNRRLLLEVAEPDWTPWELEQHGSRRLVKEFPHYKSLGVSKQPVSYVHAAQTRWGLVHLRDKPEWLGELVKKWVPKDMGIV